MEQQQLLDWIERYWRGTLSAEDRSTLDEYLRGHPEARRVFQEHSKIWQAIHEARFRDLRLKMKAWDKGLPVIPDKTEKRRLKHAISKPIKWGAVVLAVFMVLLAHQRYKPASLAISGVKQIFSPRAEGERKTERDQLIRKIKTAQYAEAIGLLQDMQLKHGFPEQQELEWGILLIDFSRIGPGESWHQALAQFQTHTDPGLRKKAFRLQRLTDNTLYNWIYGHAHGGHYTGVRPRIL